MFTVGRLAKQVDMNIETIRYYQRIGLLRTPEAEDGYRFYNQADIERLKFIKRAKHAGLALHEISELLSLDQVTQDQAADKQHMVDIVQHYQQALELRIHELKNLQQGLADWLEKAQQAQPMPPSIVHIFQHAPVPHGKVHDIPQDSPH